MIDAEEWRLIPGWGGVYEVSSLGRVRSARCVLKPFTNRQGYQLVTLYNGGAGKTFRAHRLVALAFLGPRPNGLQIAHLDGNSANNAASNLAYATQSENKMHMRLHGTANIGERNCQHKLTEEQALFILAHCKPRDPFWGPRPLSKRLDVHEATVQDVLKRRTWQYLSNKAHNGVEGEG